MHATIACPCSQDPEYPAAVGSYAHKRGMKTAGRGKGGARRAGTMRSNAEQCQCEAIRNSRVKERKRTIYSRRGEDPYIQNWMGLVSMSLLSYFYVCFDFILFYFLILIHIILHQ